MILLGNMKVLLGHLEWGLGTKDPHSDQADKTFLGVHIVSNVSKWSNLLLKMGLKVLSLAPILKAAFFFSTYSKQSFNLDYKLLENLQYGNNNINTKIFNTSTISWIISSANQILINFCFYVFFVLFQRYLGHLNHP